MTSKWIWSITFIIISFILLEGLVLAVNGPQIEQIPSISLPSSNGLAKSPYLVDSPSVEAPYSSSNQNISNEIGTSDVYSRLNDDFSTAIEISDINIESINAAYANSQWITIGGIAGHVNKYDLELKRLSWGPYEEPFGLFFALKPNLDCWLSISIPVSASRNIRYIRVLTNTSSLSPYNEIDGIHVFNGDFKVGSYNTKSWTFGGVKAHVLDLGKWAKFTNGLNIALIIKNHSTTASRIFKLNGVAAKEEW